MTWRRFSVKPQLARCCPTCGTCRPAAARPNQTLTASASGPRPHRPPRPSNGHAGPVTAIEIATGEAAISFDADRDGALRQLGFRLRPPGELRIDRGLFPP